MELHEHQPGNSAHLILTAHTEEEAGQLAWKEDSVGEKSQVAVIWEVEAAADSF